MSATTKQRRDQTLRSLAEANAARSRAAVRRRPIAQMSQADGRNMLAELLRDDQAVGEIGHVRIAKLLTWPKRSGTSTAEHELARQRISSNRRLDELTTRQRELLAGRIELGALATNRTA